jgi:hypothetical protein
VPACTQVVRRHASVRAAAESICLAKSTMSTAISQGRLLGGWSWRFHEVDEDAEMSETRGGIASGGGEQEDQESVCVVLR